jgi:hypothetical protein
MEDPLNLLTAPLQPLGDVSPSGFTINNTQIRECREAIRGVGESLPFALDHRSKERRGRHLALGP